MFEEDQTAYVTTLPKFGLPSYESHMTVKDVKSLAVRHDIPLDLYPVALTKGWTMDKLSDEMIGLYEQYFEFSRIKLVNNDIGSLLRKELVKVPVVNYSERLFLVITMSEYLRFSFLSGASIEKGTTLLIKIRVEVDDSKIVAIREKKARAAAKKRENKKIGAGKGEGSHPKVKRKKSSAAQKDGSAISEHISSLEPIRTVDPTGLAAGNRFGANAETDELWEDRSLHVHVPPHDSANHSVHNYTDARDDEETNSLRLGSFVDQSGRNLTLVQTEVFQSSLGNHYVHPSPTVERTTSPTRSHPQGTHVKEGESSRGRAYYVPKWLIYQRCHARLDLEHNATLYNDMNVRYRKVKGEHKGCAEKLWVLEDQNNKLSWVNKYQTLQIIELEDVLARKDSALVYTERINAERAQEKEKLVAVDRGASKEDLLDLMSRMEDFDAYADKKMRVEYDKLFEKRYPFVERIFNGFRHSMADLLKIYPEPPPSERAPSVTVGAPTKPSSGKNPGSSAPPNP
ncbi:hypothetical protein Tco_0271941 [Tanacetum coccineum]